VEFIVFSDIHYSLNYSKSYIRGDGISSWLHTQLDITEQIFNYAKSHKVPVIVHNGDLFDDKTRINVSLYNIIWEKYKRYTDDGFTIFFNTGNHDLLTINGESSLQPFTKIVNVISKPEFILNGVKVIPYDKIDGNLSPTGDVLLIHADIAGLKLGPDDYSAKSRLKPQMFNDWGIVLNGHIHKPQTLGNIVTIGSPMVQDWGEVEENKRFIHYKNGEVVSVPISHPQFVYVKGLSDRVLDKVRSDRYNFFKIEIDPTEIDHDIFKEYNVVPNIVKSKKRKIRIEEALDPANELIEYINTENIGNLDKEKLLAIGLELQKNRRI